MKNAKSLVPLFLLVVILLPFPYSLLDARTQQFAMIGCSGFASYLTIPEGECVRVFSGFSNMGVMDVTISKDGLYSFVCDYDGCMKYLRISDGACLFFQKKRHG